MNKAEHFAKATTKRANYTAEEKSHLWKEHHLQPCCYCGKLTDMCSCDYCGYLEDSALGKI